MLISCYMDGYDESATKERTRNFTTGIRGCRLHDAGSFPARSRHSIR